MSKTLISIIVCSVFLAGLMGAIYVMNYHQESPYNITRSVLRTVQKSLKEQDAEKFYSVFSGSSMVTREEIENLFEYVGTVESMSRSSINSGGGSVRNGIYTKYAYVGHFTAVMTDGSEYDVYFSGYAFKEDDSSKIGVERLSFTNKADEFDEYGIGSYYNKKGEPLTLDGKVAKGYERKPKT